MNETVLSKLRNNNAAADIVIDKGRPKSQTQGDH